jgi:hypothetical protein
MSAPRKRPILTIRPLGRAFGIWSDSTAAAPTGGLVLAGLSAHDCDVRVKAWTKRGIEVRDERLVVGETKGVR